MRWAWFAMMLLLMTGCVQQRTGVGRDAKLAQARRNTPQSDPLAVPRAQADHEVKRLTALRDALRTQLRSTEDQLLIVVVKSADYDEEASQQLGELQQQRLLISIALHDVEQQRRQRAEDVINGWVEQEQPPAAPPPDDREYEKKEKDKAQQDAQASALDALLARAKMRLEQARRVEDRRKRGRFGMDGLVFGMGAASPSPPTGAPRGGDGERWADAAKAPSEDETAGEGWEPTQEPKRAGGKYELSPPGGGAVQAAAVVADGAAPDLGAALRPLLPRMQACIPKERLNQGLAFTVRARLGTDGSVRGARLSGGHGLTPRAAACVVDVMRQLRLPKGGGGRIVSVPLRISAR